MAKAHDLALLDGDELSSRLGDSRRELFNLRFQLATGQLDNPARIGQVKHDVARILTVLRDREILEAEGSYVVPTLASVAGGRCTERRIRSEFTFGPRTASNAGSTVNAAIMSTSTVATPP